MSTGRTPIGSSPVLPSPDVLWTSSRRAKGPSSRAQRPNAFGKRASVCGQERCFVQDLPSKLSAASPRRHFPFLVSWVLTTVSTGYSQEDAKATALPRKGSCLSSSTISQEAEGRSHLAKGLSILETCPAPMETWLSGARTGYGRSCVTSTWKQWRALLGSHCMDEQVQPLLDTQMLSNQTFTSSCLRLSRSH